MTDNKRKTKGVPDDVDKHVGKRVRVRRSLLGMSQEKLAAAIGVTFQQIQKYERGTNRVSAGRLLRFSQILQVPVTFFYEDMDGAKSPAKTSFSDNDQESFEGTADAKKSGDDDVMAQRETLELIRAYYSVSDPKRRKDILKFIKSMTKNIP